MNTAYFLGANSKCGFYSLYSGFCTAPGDYLTVVKGTPGSGKSGFMRKIGTAAEARGLDTEYILCSGDPDSLDGVYIPSMRRGWVDGTAPHVIEPRRVGVDGDYVNLAAFCSLPFDTLRLSCVSRLYESYKAEYSAAYGYLAAAAHLESINSSSISTHAEVELRQRVRSIIKRRSSKGGNGRGRIIERFMHAISCKGELYLSGELEKLCKSIYSIDGSDGCASAALSVICEEAARAGGNCILCRAPLDPAKIDALLIPDWSLAFICGGYDIAGAKKLELTSKDGACCAQSEDTEAMHGELLSRALARLNTAKALHDELEEYYKLQMDFPALTEYTENYIELLFS